MIGSDRALARLARCSITALAVASSCSDFPRTNPVDPSATLRLTVIGPDSATATGDTVSFEVLSERGEVLNEFASWEPPGFLTPQGFRGRFVVNSSLGAARATGTVKAIIGTNTAARPFTLALKPVKLAISDCSGRTTITFVALVSPSFGPTLGTQPVCTTLLDRRGFTVNDPSGASAVIRDQSVVRFVGTGLSLLNAYGIGSTYVVFSRAGLTDSILVNARQDPASFAVEPASCRTGAGVRIAVGESLQISVLPPVRDANLNVITDPAAIQAAIASVRWRAVSPLDATVSLSGIVTPRSLNSGFVKGEMLQGITLRTVVDCYVTVY